MEALRDRMDAVEPRRWVLLAALVEAEAEEPLITH
jgi:hypothetical protein